MAYSIGFLKFFLIDTLREIIIFFFLFWWSLRNELEKVGVKGYTKNDRPDLHMKSSISVPAFLVSHLWMIIRLQQIFRWSLKLIRMMIHYDWMYRQSVTVSTKYSSLSKEPLTERSTDSPTSHRFRIISRNVRVKKQLRVLGLPVVGRNCNWN